MPVFGASVKRMLDEGGVSYGDDIVKIVTPLGYEGCANYCISIGLEGPTERVTERMRELMQDAYVGWIEAKPNVKEALLALKGRGYSINVLTASPHTVLDPCLKRLGLFDLFDNVWSCADFGTTKADPQIYANAARLMNKKTSEVIFVDDNIGSDTTAKSAGCYVIGVYDESSKDYVDDMKAVCDEYIYDFIELV